MLWLCLHLPRLGLDLFTRGIEDGAIDRPMVLVERHRLLQLNATAFARGLRPEQSLATARSICAGLVVARRHPEREAAALEQLAAWAWRFTPKVSLAPPDGLLLEVAGSLRIFRGLDRLQRQVLKGIHDLGYSALPGIAPTPLAAQALARSGTSPDPEQIASTLEPDATGPGALRRAWARAVADAVRPRLATLPLDHLDRPADEQERFTTMGLRTVADLLRLPRAALARRFGRDLLRHLDRLTGRLPDPREPVSQAPVFNAGLHFLEDVTHTPALAFPMRRLLGELSDWLGARQLATARLDWHLYHPAHGEHVLTVRCAGALNDPARFLELSRLHLERHHGLPAVAHLQLRVTHPESRNNQPGTLFPTLDGGVAGSDPATLVDLLRARLGPDVCSSLLPVDDHRPEQAWKRVPPPSSMRAGTHRPATASGPRPLWLLDPPLPLEERAGRPWWNGPLQLLRGPERIDVMTWGQERLPAACRGPRDYWVAGHDRGGYCWVFRSLTGAGWFLHGLFA